MRPWLTIPPAWIYGKLAILAPSLAGRFDRAGKPATNNDISSSNPRYHCAIPAGSLVSTAQNVVIKISMEQCFLERCGGRINWQQRNRGGERS